MKRNAWIAGAFISAVWIILYGVFYWQTWGLRNSPDENAVFVFAQHFAQQHDLSLSRPLINEIAHPRSVNIKDGQFVPGFFLGWVLMLGWAARLFGMVGLAVLPAALAVAGAWAFWGMMRRLFDERLAWLSLLLLLTLPPWWYYASRGFLPNVAFVSCLLISVYALFRARESWAWSVLAGLAAGCALAIRPNEVIWIILSAGLCWRYLRGLGVKRLMVVAISLSLPLILVGYWQSVTFGHWYATGYQSFSAAGESVADQSVLALLFPFGLHPWLALLRFISYQGSVLIWLAMAAVLGGLAWAKNPNKTPEQKTYTRVFLLICMYLLLYYGSWQFADHPDASRLTLGVSYGRYWLPIYVMAIPLVVIGCESVVARFKLGRWGVPAMMIVFITLNTLAVYGLGDENLGQLRRNIVEYGEWRDEVLAHTEPDAVIISERNDKVFWPGRQVISYEPTDYAFLSETATVAEQAPLYVFTAIPRPDMQVIEQREYIPRGLRLQYIRQISGTMTLYRVEPFST